MGDRLLTFIKIACIFYLVLFVPRIISVYNDRVSKTRPKKPAVTLGIENLAHASGVYDEVKTIPIALVIENTSFDQQGNRSIDLLLDSGFSVKKIAKYFRGSSEDSGAKKGKITPVNDSKTQLPVYRLNEPSIRQLSATFLKDVEAIVLDIQDYGLRDDPGAKLLLDVLQCAAEHKKKVIVTDRINPLGSPIEGPGDIPLRHGMTIGELATFYNMHVLHKKADLKVVPLSGWKRNDPLRGSHHRNLSASELYETTLIDLLKEIRPVLVVKDDDCPTLVFPPGEELSEWESNYLKELCHKLNLQALDCSYWDKEQGQLLKGVRLRLRQGETSFSAFNTALTLIRFLKNRKGINVSYSDVFDKVMGSGQVRKFFDGKIRFAQLKKDVDKHTKHFYEKSQKCFLYDPLPHVNTVHLVKN